MMINKELISKLTFASTAKSSNKAEQEELFEMRNRLNAYQKLEHEYKTAITKYDIIKRLLYECEKKLDTVLKENKNLMNENKDIKEKNKKLTSLNRQIIRKYGVEHEKCRSQHEGMISPFDCSRFQAGGDIAVLLMQARLCEDLITRKSKTKLGGYTNFMRNKADKGDILHELKQEVKKDWLASINKREKLLNKGKYRNKKLKKAKGGSFKDNKTRFRGASEYLSKGGTTLRGDDTTEIPSRSRGNTCLTAFSPLRSKGLGKSSEENICMTPDCARKSPFHGSPSTLERRRGTMASAKWKKRRELKAILDRPRKEKEQETELKVIKKKLKVNYFENKKHRMRSFESDTSLWLKRELKRKKLRNKKRRHRGKFAKYCDGLTSDHIKKENLNTDITLTGIIDKNPIFGFSKFSSVKLINKISKRSSRAFKS